MKRTIREVKAEIKRAEKSLAAALPGGCMETVLRNILSALKTELALMRAIR